MNLVQSAASAMTGGKMSDAMIAGDLFAMIKAGALASTAFCLESATPELHTFFAQCTQNGLLAQATLTQLAQQKGWYHPYQAPVEQLKEDLQFAQALQ